MYAGGLLVYVLRNKTFEEMRDLGLKDKVNFCKVTIEATDPSGSPRAGMALIVILT